MKVDAAQLDEVSDFTCTYIRTCLSSDMYS